MSTWEKLPAWQGDVYNACLCCPTTERIAPLDMIIAVGFGDAKITKDGETIYREEDSDDFRTLLEFEQLAQQDPNHDWRAILNGPLRGRTYQRHGKNKWILVDYNGGFA